MLVHIYNGSTTYWCHTEDQVLSAIAEIMNECKSNGNTINIHIEHKED